MAQLVASYVCGWKGVVPRMQFRMDVCSSRNVFWVASFEFVFVFVFGQVLYVRSLDCSV